MGQLRFAGFLHAAQAQFLKEIIFTQTVVAQGFPIDAAILDQRLTGALDPLTHPGRPASQEAQKPMQERWHKAPTPSAEKRKCTSCHPF